MLNHDDSDATLIPMSQSDFLNQMANHDGGLHVRPLKDGSGAVVATPIDNDRLDKAVFITAEFADIYARPATQAEWNAANAVMSL
jgi:hypothetical protein